MMLTSNVVESLPGTFVLDLSGIDGARWFNEHNRDFIVRHRPVLHTTRYNEKFIFLQYNCSVAKFEGQFSIQDQEHLVFFLMAVPDEFTLQLGQLHLLSIEFTGDPRMPMVREQSEFFFQIDLIHGHEVRCVEKRRPEETKHPNCWRGYP